MLRPDDILAGRRTMPLTHDVMAPYLVEIMDRLYGTDGYVATDEERIIDCHRFAAYLVGHHVLRALNKEGPEYYNLIPTGQSSLDPMRLRPASIYGLFKDDDNVHSFVTLDHVGTNVSVIGVNGLCAVTRTHELQEFYEAERIQMLMPRIHE